MRDQQKTRILRIKELATRSIGEVGTAVALIILGAADEALLDDALRFGKENPDKVEKFIEDSLYFNWLVKSLKKVWAVADSIDFGEIAEFDRAGRSTVNLFENKIQRMQDELRSDPSGALHCLAEILSKHESGSFKLPNNALHLIVNIKENCDSILYEINRTKEKAAYKITNPKVIFAVVAAFFILTPVLYAFDAYRQHGSVSVGVEQDATRLQRAASDGGQSTAQRILSVSKEVLDIAPKIPAALLVLAAVLAFVRSLLPKGKASDASLKAFEDRFRVLGTALRDAVK